MTAIVSILNKHAVSLAADSAMTIGGRKVYNSANKLFALSKYKPVAIAFYNNLNLVNCPWEVVTKEYRRHLGKRSFATLLEYVADFFNYLKTQNYFSTVAEQHQQIEWEFQNYLDSVLDDMNRLNLTNEFNAFVKNQETQFYSRMNNLVSIGPLSKDEFKLMYDHEISEALRHVKNVYNVDLDKDIVSHQLFSMFVKDMWLSNMTGIVFCGYGDKEIYPCLYNYDSYVVINNKLAIFPHDEKAIEIGKPAPAAIRTFAQTDVMDTLTFGIAPSVRTIYRENLSKPLIDVLNKIGDKVGNAGVKQTIADFIKNDLDSYVDDYMSECAKAAQKTYAQPFLNSMTSLEKEDLADFAESMIKVTSIKRKVSPTLATVDGPIDVMVISKAEGVIWIKRKHYFSPELNHSFFNNYHMD